MTKRSKATEPDGNDFKYWSVDSAPRRLAERVPALRAPALLVVFCAIAAAQLWMINLIPSLNGFFLHNDWVFAPATGGHSIPLRIFMVSFFIAFGLCCDPRWLRKLAVAFDMALTFALLCLLMDLLLQLAYALTGTIMTLHIIEIASGLLGFAVFSFKLLERGEMPSRLPMRVDNRQTRMVAFRLVIVALIAATLAWTVASLDLPLEQRLRNVSLLGGIGPGVFLFLPLFFILLYLGAWVEDWMTPKPGFNPDMTVFMPAHNEAHIVADTIRTMDAAAAQYGGRIRLLVMNNASTDTTKEVAEAALRDCVALDGEVLDVETPGKAHALNAGLDAVKTEFCVRVDADTQLKSDVFVRAMPHFADPSVGVLGGLPLPRGGGPFDRARFLEVAVKHGFYARAFSTINSVVGIPGMFSVYRTHLPRDLGGFVSGMNGEDTDISLRAAETGYKLVVDPSVQYYSEVPATYQHMREQRTRWFRSTFHISSRCRDLIFAPQTTVRGKVILPYMLINSARRAMMIPLLAFGLVEYLTVFDSFNTLIWQSLVAVLIGAPALMAALSALLLRRPKAILYLPEYLLFRALRAYFTLESMLSIVIKNSGEPLYSRRVLTRQRVVNPRNA